MKKTVIILLTLLISVVSFAGCKAEESAENGDKKTVAVSIVPEATFVNKVCGNKFNIVTVIPAGASPETYEPSPAEMKEISEAELYFSIGVPAEENSILPIISKETKTVALHTKVSAIYPDRTDDGGRDPHIWLSPKRVMVMVASIAEAFKETDPENAEFYETNANEYIKELENLDSYIITALAGSKNRKFIAFHPAFGYFAEDYSLTMYALEEHGKETTAKRLAEMADLAKRENIKSIFYQAEASKKQALAFAEEIDGKAVMLEPLSSDYIANLKAMTDSLKEAIK
ncbi:MAG: zinc ABC transporter substrate-binding protein [Clostridia bacterium]|nr:ABC transporter substrate-binding protein [Oscillospiraceae bacterium]MBP3600594.1 zinc ABC transporter substrate-binding protein [Clostridia bacterium]